MVMLSSRCATQGGLRHTVVAGWLLISSIRANSPIPDANSNTPNVRRTVLNTDLRIGIKKGVVSQEERETTRVLCAKKQVFLSQMSKAPDSDEPWVDPELPPFDATIGAADRQKATIHSISQ